MAYSPIFISNNLLQRAFNEGAEVSPMKLQKLLYFVASEYGKRTNRELLAERFQPWQYGPVVRSVYDEFRSFRGSPITKFAVDAEKQAYVIDEKSDPDLQVVLDRVWEAAKPFSAVQLSRITHAPGSAWSSAYEGGTGWIDESDLRDDNTYCSRLGLDVR